jgi:hypothetical protein
MAESKNTSQAKYPLKNYNIFALQGDQETDDMDVVETMGLDPVVAYTPHINVAAINKMEMENVKGYMDMGMPEARAKNLAKFSADATRASIRALMADQKIDFNI